MLNTFDDATTRDILTLVRLFRRNGWSGGGVPPGQSQLQLPTPIYFTNDSGEEIPPYACMQVTGTEEIGNQNYVVVDKPSTFDGHFLFNNHTAIADDSEGVAQSGPVVRAFRDSGGPTPGVGIWGPVEGEWYLDQDTDGFVAVGLDDLADDVVKVMPVPKNIAFFETPSGGIAAKVGNTIATASCTLIYFDGTTRTLTSYTATVSNDFLGPIAGLVDIAAAWVNGRWVVIAEDCEDPGTGGGISPAPSIAEYTNSAATYNVGDNDEDYLSCDCSSNSITATLDKTLIVDIHIKLSDVAGSYALTIDGDGENIDGAATLVLTSKYDSVHLVYSNVNSEWYIV